MLWSVKIADVLRARRPFLNKTSSKQFLSAHHRFVSACLKRGQEGSNCSHYLVKSSAMEEAAASGRQNP